MGELLPKAILLDLDDTIIAFSSNADLYWRTVCDRFAHRVDGIAPDRLFDAIKASRTRFWQDPGRSQKGRLDLIKTRREIVVDALRPLGTNTPDLATEIADSYSTEREEGISPFPGAIEALHHLRAQGVRLALITNGSSESQRSKIRRFGFADLFDVILIEGEFGVGKPDERIYLHALSQLEMEPEDTWMVGDNLEWEVAAPQRLGIRGIWVDNAGFGMDETSSVQPDRIIRSLSELIQ